MFIYIYITNKEKERRSRGGAIQDRSVALSGVAALINLDLSPRCRVAYRALLQRTGVQRATSLIVEDRFMEDFPGYVVYVKRKRDANLEDVLIYQLNKDNRIERLIEHGTRVQAFASRRQYSSQVGTGTVRTGRQHAKRRVGRISYVCSQRTHRAECFVPRGDIAKQHQRVFCLLECGNDLSWPISRQQLDQSCARQIMINLEKVLVLLAAGKADPCAGESCLSHAMRQYRCLAAKIRTNDENSVVLLDVRDVATEPRKLGIAVLIREIASFNAMVNIRCAEMIDKTGQQMSFLDGDTR